MNMSTCLLCESHGTEALMNMLIPPILPILMLAISPLNLLYIIELSMIRSFTMEDLPRKVVLITGASSGIGEYAKQGARLALVARREKLLEEVAKRAAPWVLLMLLPLAPMFLISNTVRDSSKKLYATSDAWITW
ncbi:hypothetical protein Sjap_016552 [Stephania japonica]|uniref:Uncharacterized protein n=1 Tax=Stephania japonica TaxID=461633 RepID=A0AAP0ILS8_9MAGN